MQTNYTYLALGDSYTIGEGVLLQHSYPYQLVQLLRKEGYNMYAPEIIARTGWTTEDLSSHIQKYKFLPQYDFVSLLIGVNNQYQDKPIIQYTMELEQLLQKAISLSIKKEHVFVISIPDYGVTPFGKKKDAGKISHDLEVYNNVGKALAIQYKVQYIDIFNDSKKAVDNASLLAADALHPSEKMYAKWAKKLASTILKAAGKNNSSKA